jgi:hypothetical protein
MGKNCHRQGREKLYAGRNRKMGQMGDTEDEKGKK